MRGGRSSVVSLELIGSKIGGKLGGSAELLLCEVMCEEPLAALGDGVR